MGINLNTAEAQKSFTPIPDGIYPLHVTIKPGGAAPDGWPKESKDGQSVGLDMEYTVFGGEHAGRKIWERLTISGTEQKHKDAAEGTHAKLRAFMESALGIEPNDMSDAACQARSVASYEDFCDLLILGKVGTQPPKDGYEAKNTLRYVVIPGMKDWHQVEQVKAQSAAPVNSYAAASAARSHEPPAPPATLVKPGWAGAK